ncbi:Predicted arabinose efflux permease, MFS family [Thermostaphylospora chromogena]|uniref:Predicted arabinose efflux permease, MFS family n=2 Tax=Thermostaphylospora chromogena TaxID=35622 RepID=A0A1H1BMI4_9ACTN|nr:Predicted arabinose efflux permease, MFS family [Thermostaphylospora chromogena]
MEDEPEEPEESGAAASTTRGAAAESRRRPHRRRERRPGIRLRRRVVKPAETGGAAGSAEKGGMFRSLRNRNYRLFASGAVVSNVGTWMQRTAQDWLVLDLTDGSATALGTATALQFTPQLLLGLWGGVIADRYAKRKLLIIAQVLMGVLALTLGILTVTGAAQVWHVYAMALAVGIIACVDMPARQSFVVEMVGRKDLPNAIALNSSSFNLARVMGPALAGVLIYALGGTGPIFLINAFSFAAVITSLLLMRASELHPADPVPRAKGQLRQGLRYVLDHHELLAPITLVAFMSMFMQSFSMSIALMAKGVYGAGASSFGIASSAFAVGALAGALLAARRVRPTRRLLIGGAVAFGIAQIASGLAPWYPVYLAVLVPAGIAMITVNTAANATVQLASAPEMRGRVMAIYMLVFTGGAPIGAPLIGWVTELGGPRVGLMIAGTLSIACTGLALLLAKTISRRRESHAIVRGTAAAAGVAR